VVPTAVRDPKVSKAAMGPPLEMMTLLPQDLGLLDEPEAKVAVFVRCNDCEQIMACPIPI
jgi:hypothetical protein